MDDALVLTLLLTPGIGRRTIHKLIPRFPEQDYSPGDVRAALEAARKDVPRLVVPAPGQLEEAGSAAAAMLHSAGENGIRFVPVTSPLFPASLAAIPDPPVGLFVRGDLEALRSGRAVAVIGTREPSPLGVAFARDAAAGLAQAGYVVVGGLAYGCDAAAHEGALSVEGRTGAFLAHGLDKVYPREHARLADEMAEKGGFLASEYPPGTAPSRVTFVDRDRLQSGLATGGVVVVETDVEGGTMHTVRFAEAQGRAVFAFAHPAGAPPHPKARGNQLLLAEGRASGASSPAQLLAAIQSPGVPATRAAPAGEPARVGKQTRLF